MTEPAFDNMLSPIASTEEEVGTDMRTELANQGSKIANLSPVSPFFLILRALLAVPLLALRALVLGTLLPGLFLKTAAGALLDIIAWAYSVTRNVALAAELDITFTRSGSTGALPIPVNTEVEAPPIDGVTYKLVALAGGTIPDGQTSALVRCTAEQAGVAYNLGEGFYSVLPTPVTGVTAVRNDADALITSGADTEKDDPLRERCRLKVASLGQGTFGYYINVIVNFTGVGADDVFVGDYGNRGFGSRDFFYLLDSGNPSTAQLAALNTHIMTDGNHLDGDDPKVFALPGLTVIGAVTIHVDAETTATERTAIQTAVNDRMRAAFRDNQLFPEIPRVRPNETYRYADMTSEILKALPQVRALDYSPAAIIPGQQLPVLSSLTVTVV